MAKTKDELRNEKRTKILALEQQLKKETVKYTRNRIIEQLRVLKNEYLDLDDYEMPETISLERIYINPINTFKENIIMNLQSNIIEINDQNFKDFNPERKYQKITLINLSNKSNLKIKADQVEITQCQGLDLQIEAETIMIKETDGCYFSLAANQLRLRNTKNIQIAFNKSVPTVLEHSKQIKFKLPEESQSDKHLIKDFDCPFNSPNYEIVY